MAGVYDRAWQTLKDHEGGYCVDSGGPTNFGVTIPVLSEYYSLTGMGDADHDEKITSSDIKSLTESLSKDVFKQLWWDRYGYGKITNETIAIKIFDIAVNVGPHPGHVIAQRALRSVGLIVKEDGRLGPITLKAINAADPRLLIIALRSEAAGYYRLIIQRHPDMSIYEAGWLGRAYS